MYNLTITGMTDGEAGRMVVKLQSIAEGLEYKTKEGKGDILRMLEALSKGKLAMISMPEFPCSAIIVGKLLMASDEVEAAKHQEAFQKLAGQIIDAIKLQDVAIVEGD